ncbi:aminotransferase class V-fold PLP-dependent enzyme [uncultured Actinomyces sp.]|uniref:cysteine desulfurase family protein n=1 Tax=uncultured Actinomyces sp. TaxID=249061 RepID=UPI0028ED3F99|nr:aminotransferase class V-fold PLP-dependent enzyme [uncultured Actinomyces sp.]
MSVYLDHAATTPLRECALDAWTRVQRDLAASPGNPAALHFGGRRARRMLDDAREQVAEALGADIHEVVFTSGATESDALGVIAAARGARAREESRALIVVSGVEHDAVAHQREVASREGFSWEVLPVDAGGVSILPVVGGDDVPPSWDGRLAVGSMALVSSEIGTIQPVADFVELVHATGGFAHSDAAQAIPTLDVSFVGLGLDLMSVGGHKIGAPAGTGVLLARRGIPMTTDRPGGGHERSIRSGTPDVAGACALAAALTEVVSERAAFAAHAADLRAHLLAHLPDGVVPTAGESASCPAIIHLSLPTARPEAVLMAFDMAGIAVSAGSACHAGVTRPSDIVMAMGRTEEQALGVLRVSLGRETTRDDIDAFLSALPAAMRAGAALDGVAHVRNERNEER